MLDLSPRLENGKETSATQANKFKAKEMFPTTS